MREKTRYYLKSFSSYNKIKKFGKKNFFDGFKKFLKNT